MLNNALAAHMPLLGQKIAQQHLDCFIKLALIVRLTTECFSFLLHFREVSLCFPAGVSWIEKRKQKNVSARATEILDSLMI